MSKVALTRVVSAAVALVAVVGFAATANVSADATSISSRIAEAKSKVWGEYPKAEQAWPEFERPVAVIAAAPAKTEAAAPVVETKAVKAETAATEVKKAAPVEAKTVAAPAKTDETQVVKAEAAAAPAAAPAAVEAPVAAAPVAVATTGDMWIDEIVRLTNEARSAEGLAPLSLNTTLNQGAAIRVPELPSSPAPHVRPNGDAFYTIYGQIGMSVRAGGENYAIATANAYTPEQIVNAWLASPGHRANIMNSKYTQIGVGHGVIGESEYFEQLFSN